MPDQSPNLDGPGGPWQQETQEIAYDGFVWGRTNPGWGCVETQNQLLSAGIRAYAFRLSTDPSNPKQFYALYGSLFHSIQHGMTKDANGNPKAGVTGEAYDPSANWVSVGYYATSMSLFIDLPAALQNNPNAILYAAGPDSTVGESSTSFSIGGDLNAQVGDFNTVGGAVNASFGASYSTPAVTLAEQKAHSGVTWQVALPGVGFQSPGLPANPKEPSYAGYTFYFGGIWQIPADATFSVLITPAVHWEFDWTRGIKNDTKSWSDARTFTFTPAATPATPTLAGAR